MALRLDAIDFFDATNRCVVHRVPADGSAEIAHGAQLVVQQNQEAVFYYQGDAKDVFGPGRHRLVADNLPIIARMLSLPWQSIPFSAVVYFVGKQTFTDQRWGTRQPIAMRDRDFGVVRLRGFGNFSFRVQNSGALINTIVGTQGRITTEEITAFLRELIVARLTDLLGTSELGVLELPAHMDELSAAARAKISDDFTRYGLELVDFFVSSLTLPEEVQKAIDAGSSANVAARIRKVPPATPVGLNVVHLVCSAARDAGWSFHDLGNEQAEIVVPLGPTRRQRVHVDFGRRDAENSPMVRFHTVCGPATPDNALTYLRWNRQLSHGAFAVEPGESGDVIVLAVSQLANAAEADEVTRQIAAIALQADQLERQLRAGDDAY